MTAVNVYNTTNRPSTRMSKLCYSIQFQCLYIYNAMIHKNYTYQHIYTESNVAHIHKHIPSSSSLSSMKIQRKPPQRQHSKQNHKVCALLTVLVHWEIVPKRLVVVIRHRLYINAIFHPQRDCFSQW